MPVWIILITAAIAFGVSAVTGKFFVPFMKKISFGQTIRESGPTWHQSKQGTPIMGGARFILGTLVAVIFGVIAYSVFLNNIGEGATINNGFLKLLAGIIATFLFCLVGFVDDYIKAIKKRNLGLNSKQKLIFQFLISAGYLAALYFLGDKATTINFYFFELNLGIFYYPIMVLFITFIVNAVNLTDGIDGLCGSVTVVSMLCFAFISLALNQYYTEIYAIAVAGACIGFLVWNLHPAKIFMGDTGSMFLGGAVVVMGMSMRLHIVLVLVALVYVLEAFSVVLQVISFKLTKKRIFKMSPIHHHFEMCGWGEYKIVIIFSVVGLLSGVLGSVIAVMNDISHIVI